MEKAAQYPNPTLCLAIITSTVRPGDYRLEYTQNKGLGTIRYCVGPSPLTILYQDSPVTAEEAEAIAKRLPLEAFDEHNAYKFWIGHLTPNIVQKSLGPFVTPNPSILLLKAAVLEADIKGIQLGPGLKKVLSVVANLEMDWTPFESTLSITTVQAGTVIPIISARGIRLEETEKVARFLDLVITYEDRYVRRWSRVD